MEWADRETYPNMVDKFEISVDFYMLQANEATGNFGRVFFFLRERFVFIILLPNMKPNERKYEGKYEAKCWCRNVVPYHRLAIKMKSGNNMWYVCYCYI